MAMSYRIDRVAEVIHLVGTGVLTDDEMVDCVQEMRSDPALFPGLPTLSDMRGVKRFEISAQGFERMLKVMEPTRGARGVARAAIVVKDDLGFGLGRMLSVLAELEEAQPSFRVFRDIGQARAWLGLDRDE